MRVALILRRLHDEVHAGAEPYLARRELAHVERMRGELHRAGWFN